ncbi:ATP-binding protein [Undibacterium sp. RTI2.1]|uniref:sensor histidine kinase n=1 Tax=unclassified Undibacterium TaxID=2630295 RepID=UPI002AB4B5C7|nr:MULTISPECIES: ATP-binding protein [unclassified Undibacterium]MDY7539417.1 ATP-binding protein [Undibacterium sp. 5I1]MEB0029665.1 ATP-binding protein [Undibacterium sp. RTI2.1]MEB0116136.1 ATP-binding protein [Undibacterium sp. RTI2.2]MEB0231364.1 ATP-binding protein [Undibacterium sp. 10I3]MEB0258364.1 ATP-binding protein [Undibacterium sp. 5I1]
MTRFLRYALIIGGALMSILLFFLTTASENSANFEHYYGWLLGANAVIAFALSVLVITLLWRLLRRYRTKEFGSRLMTRLVMLFALVGILPGAVIYVVSVQFVSRSIESWFDVKVEAAIESGLNLGRSALEFSLADLESKAQNMSGRLSEPSEMSLSIRLGRLREQLDVQDATIVNSKGRVIATASANMGRLVPDLPTPAMIRQARVSHAYAATEGNSEPVSFIDNSAANAGASRPVLPAEPRDLLRSRVVIALHSATGTNTSGLSLQNEAIYLQLIHPVPTMLATHAEALRNASAEYQVRSLGRGSLKTMYIFTLTLTLLLAIFAAVTSAFLISGELARPLLLLAEGTKAVAEGNLSPRPIITTSDELGSLTQSFNTMTRQLFDARAAVEKNRSELENAKAYLESVLANMSAGVMVLDQHANLVTCNESVERILQRSLEHDIGKPISEIEGMSGFAVAVDKAFSEQHAQSAAGGEDENAQHWQQQIEIPRLQTNRTESTAPNNTEEQGITLLARGSHLPVSSGNGYVVVFDDISNIISAQRSIAWGEVARRLAHEIKNPLTPIQLSAERLQMKLQDKLSEADVAILKKSTTTIVNQVTSMKRMVDDFRDYAKTPPAVLTPLNLTALIDEVLHLYMAGDGRDAIKLRLASNLPLVMGDATQLRQVIHNLLQNAQDAVADNAKPGAIPQIDVVAELVRYTSADKAERAAVRLSIIDNGPGFSSKILARAFEPYATSKPRGTGLGLAMVKKIIDEHGGRIDIQNRSDTNGAKISILLLKLAPDSNVV